MPPVGRQAQKPRLDVGTVASPARGKAIGPELKTNQVCCSSLRHIRSPPLSNPHVPRSLGRDSNSP